MLIRPPTNGEHGLAVVPTGVDFWETTPEGRAADAGSYNH